MVAKKKVIAKKRMTRAPRRAVIEPPADAIVHTDRSNNALRVGDLVSVPCVVHKIHGDDSTVDSRITLELEPQVGVWHKFLPIKVHHKQVDLISRGV